MEEKIAKLMKSLDCTREEAISVIEDDKRIDKGEKLFESTAEQNKVAKQSCATGTKKRTVYKFDSAKSKIKDTEKEEIVQKFFEFAQNFTENCEIVNANREISFELGGNSYSLVLSKHRKK